MVEARELTELIWASLKPALAEISDAVRREVPVVRADIGKLETAAFPLRGFLIFRGDRDPQTEEDVVVSITCQYSSKQPLRQTKLEFGSDIFTSCDGQNKLAQGPTLEIDIDTAPIDTTLKIDAWIAETRVFLLANKNAVRTGLA